MPIGTGLRRALERVHPPCRSARVGGEANRCAELADLLVELLLGAVGIGV